MPPINPPAPCTVTLPAHLPPHLHTAARYLKEVDASETTLRFWQEIYDDQNRLVEVHEKYPVDKGHRKL